VNPGRSFLSDATHGSPPCDQCVIKNIRDPDPDEVLHSRRVRDLDSSQQVWSDQLRCDFVGMFLSLYASPIDFNTKSAIRFISSRVAPFTACTVRPAITVAMKRARSAGLMSRGSSPAL
jgi:hypothetical protein